MFDWHNKNSTGNESTERTRLISLSEKELMIEMEICATLFIRIVCHKMLR